MHARSPGPSIALGLFLLVGCKPDGPIEPSGLLEVGQSLSVAGPRGVTLIAGAGNSDYYAVVVNTNFSANASESFTLRGEAIITPSAYLAATGGPSLSRIRAPEGGVAPGEPMADYAFERRLRERERNELTPRMPAARAWFAARAASRPAARQPGSPSGFDLGRRDQAIPASVKVGDTVTVNVNGNEACTDPIYHKARVAAITTRAIILDDVNNPKPGFTDVDFQRFATRFDTLVYPLDVTTFGAPTDIDNNGRVAIIFTLEVNRITPPNASFYIGGFTFSRDLFPLVATPRAAACPTSNEGEYFYLLTPDPLGTVNGNRRSALFVDSIATAVIAHEFEHLINVSRRLYVNQANVFEARWLDEGLAHVAEELLFYREAGLGPRANLGIDDITASQRRRTAYNLDMNGNAGRYRSFLLQPMKNSPYASNDSLATRGAAWDLLRYLVDRTSATDADLVFRLANSPDSGVTNMRTVFGPELAAYVRDWSVSHAVDDLAGVQPEFLQKSWNWHSIYSVMNGTYPLPAQTMAGATTYSGTLVPGGSAYYKLGVPANGSATITLGGQSGSASSNLQLVIVRTK